MLKKIVCMCMAAAFAFGSVQGVMAMGNDKTAEIITKAKELFEIGAEYEDFNYSIDIADNVSCVVMNWNDSDNGLYIDVSMDEDGYVRSFNKSSGVKDGLGSLGAEETERAAAAFLAKVVPAEYLSGLKVSEVHSGGGYRSYEYKYYVNGIPCMDDSAYINVSTTDGAVYSYDAIDRKIFDRTFPSTGGEISIDEAKDKYKEISEMDFSYRSKRNANNAPNDESSVYPAYSIKKGPEAIDAKMGTEVKSSDGTDGFKYSNYAAAEEAAVADAGGMQEFGSLTDSEIAAIKEKDDIITKEEALAALLKGIEIKDISGLRYYLSFRKNEDKNQYFWNIMNENTDAEIDASKGQLIYYSDYEANRKTWEKSEANEGSEVSYDVLKGKADRLANLYAADIIEETKLMDTEPDEVASEYTFSYVRYANGLEYSGNYIDISFNKYGELTNYCLVWDYDAVFEDVSDAIGEDGIYENMFAEEPPVLCYIMTDEGERLVYYFSLYSMIFDKKGNRTDYNGEPYYDDEDALIYTDIAGTKYEDIIKLLFENGYRLKKDRFLPEEPVTTEDFAELFGFNCDYREGGRVINWRDKPYGENLTYYEAAEILALVKVDKSVLDAAEIFDTSYYTDEIDERYKGAVAVCHGLGYMKGNNDGSFGGDRLVTNEEAAYILYNYIINS